MEQWNIRQKTYQRSLSFFILRCQDEGEAIFESIRETMQPIRETTLVIARMTSVGIMAGESVNAARALEPEADLREK